MKKDQLKADLTILKRYIKELESSLEATYDIREKADSTQDSYADFMVSLSKSIGLLSGIATESGLLIGDLQKISHYSLPGSVDEEKTLDMFKSILSPAPTKKRGAN